MTQCRGCSYWDNCDHPQKEYFSKPIDSYLSKENVIVDVAKQRAEYAKKFASRVQPKNWFQPSFED